MVNEQRNERDKMAEKKDRSCFEISIEIWSNRLLISRLNITPTVEGVVHWSHLCSKSDDIAVKQWLYRSKKVIRLDKKKSITLSQHVIRKGSLLLVASSWIARSVKAQRKDKNVINWCQLWSKAPPLHLIFASIYPISQIFQRRERYWSYLISSSSVSLTSLLQSK